MKILIYAIVLISGGLVSSCGGGSGNSGSNSGVNAFAGKASIMCPELTGIEGIFWDFINGTPRGDLPPTAFTIPFNIQGVYQNSNSLLLGFTVPVGWNVNDATDISGITFPNTVVGANLIRDSSPAYWRYMMNAQIISGSNFTSSTILNNDIDAFIGLFGDPAPQTTQCEFSVQQNGILGLESYSGKIVRAGDITVMARVGVKFIQSIGSAFYDAFLVAAPTSEMPQLIYDIYTPMITQLYGGGSSDDPACSDGRDNDGDQLIDYPNDPQCQNPADDSESN
jgi:hypothetical protein